jgi:hypothetical protein
VAEYAERLSHERSWPTLETLQRRFADRLGIDPAVVLAPPSPRGRRARRLDEAYELQISERGRLPTRAGSWHDLMNLLVWCAFPLSKRALVERHRRALFAGPAPRRGLAIARTPERDALSILDEGGALVLCRDGAAVAIEVPGALEAALRAGQVRVLLFGHALLEAAVSGDLAERDLRAAGVACVVSDPATATMEEADAALQRFISDDAALRRPDRRASFWLRATGAIS